MQNIFTGHESGVYGPIEDLTTSELQPRHNQIQAANNP